MDTESMRALQAQLEGQRATIERLKQEQATLAPALDAARSDAASKAAAAASLARELQQRETELEAVRSEVRSLRASSAASASTSSDTRVSDARAQLLASEARAAFLEEQIASVKQEAFAAARVSAASVREQSGRSADSEEARAGLERALTSLRAKEAELEALAAASAAENEVLRGKIRSLETQLSVSEGALGRSRDQLKKGEDLLQQVRESPRSAIRRERRFRVYPLLDCVRGGLGSTDSSPGAPLLTRSPLATFVLVLNRLPPPTDPGGVAGGGACGGSPRRCAECGDRHAHRYAQPP